MGRLNEALIGDNPVFDGRSFVASRDQVRLWGQLEATRVVLLDHQWHTLAEIAKRVNGSEAGVSARIRDLRKARWGSHTIDRQYVDAGIWKYRMAD